VKIYKYPLDITDEQDVLMPSNHHALSVGAQNGQLFVWAGVDETKGKVPVKFYIVGTGNPADHVTADGARFVGTVHMPPFVWHVFVMEAAFAERR
jgi:hypothetical protein